MRDMVEAQEIIVPLVNTQDNDADFFTTKPLPHKRFKYLRRCIMNLDDSHAANVARSTAGGRWNAGG